MRTPFICRDCYGVSSCVGDFGYPWCGLVNPCVCTRAKSCGFVQIVAAQGEQIKLLTQELDATKAKLASTDADVKITEERLVSTVEFVEQQSTGNADGANWWDRTRVGGYAEVHYNNIDAEDENVIHAEEQCRYEKDCRL